MISVIFVLAMTSIRPLMMRALTLIFALWHRSIITLTAGVCNVTSQSWHCDMKTRVSLVLGVIVSFLPFCPIRSCLGRGRSSRLRACGPTRGTLGSIRSSKERNHQWKVKGARSKRKVIVMQLSLTPTFRTGIIATVTNCKSVTEF